MGVNNKVYYNAQNTYDKASKLIVYDLKEKKETEHGSNASYTVSPNGKKMLVRMGGKWRGV